MVVTEHTMLPAPAPTGPAAMAARLGIMLTPLFGPTLTQLCPDPFPRFTEVLMWPSAFLGAEGSAGKALPLLKKHLLPQFVFYNAGPCPEQKLPGINASLLILEENIREISSSFLTQNLYSLGKETKKTNKKNSFANVRGRRLGARRVPERRRAATGQGEVPVSVL